MRIRSTVRVGVGVLATAVVGVGVGASALAAKDDSNGADNGIHGTTKTQSKDCTVNGQKEGTFTYTGPDQLWPPNHKYRHGTITLTDVDNPEEELTDEVTLMTRASHDQVLGDGTELNGSGHTPVASDATPAAGVATGTDTATQAISMRGERSGRDKTGRTYTFDLSGSSVDGSGLPGAGKVCAPVSFTATVPHDQRKK